jgi:hypothetical protein
MSKSNLEEMEGGVAIYLRNKSSVFLEVQPERIEERSEDSERESLTAQKAARNSACVCGAAEL